MKAILWGEGCTVYWEEDRKAYVFCGSCRGVKRAVLFDMDYSSRYWRCASCVSKNHSKGGALTLVEPDGTGALTSCTVKGALETIS